MFPSSTSIRKKVLAAVEKAIENRQKVLDAELKRLEEEFEKSKKQTVDNAVNEILSKINFQ